ncbi:MAG: protein translocase subunit SecDF [Bacteroidales bacterium]|nr:protein translocase subunit SecDF [Bacteroidales bacterium]
MQNKGILKFFAIVFAIVCIFQLSFTFFTKRVENRAKEYARNKEAIELAAKLSKGDKIKEGYYLDSLAKVREKFYKDSMSNQVIYNILIRKYTYKECLQREINLGLDLKGGMNVTLEVSVADIIKALSGNCNNPTFVKVINTTIQKQKNSQSDFITLFEETFKEIDPNAKLASFFNTVELKDKINYKSTNEEVIKVLREESNDAIDRSYKILRTRIDRFGVAQPNIQKSQTSAGRILVELPGIKDASRVRKLLQGTAKLEFWETYEFSELTSYFDQANVKLRSLLAEESKQTEAQSVESKSTENKTETKKEIAKKETAKKETVKTDTTEEKSELEKQLESDTTNIEQQKEQSFKEYAKKYPLYAYLTPAFYKDKQGQYTPGRGARVGFAAIKDTARVNNMLKKVKDVFPRNLKLAWTVKPEKDQPDILQLIALKITSRDGTPPLNGDVITDARQDYDQNGKIEVTMSMNNEGTRIWKRLTADNIGKQIAIVLDNYVYSFPVVNTEISNGRSSISGGSTTIEEAKDLANILKAGKLPAPAHIVQEEIVGPSLGKEAINEGLLSLIFSFVLVLLFMIFYYNKAGYVADVCLATNVFFLFGVLASLGAVLTLPGMAGIVLTLGMAVDANVIIYERIKEETRAGKGVRLAINDGYKNAYSAIIDGNVTTLSAGIVLYIFGSGPVQGFATTLIIGILSSLFSAIFISRLIFDRMLEKNKSITFGNKFSLKAFTNIKLDFLGKKNLFYIISAVVITIGIISLLTRGLNQGVDFAGGRTYVVRFDNDVNTKNIQKDLSKIFKSTPEVKTFGPRKQVKITTKYLINDNSMAVDSLIESKLYEGLKSYYKTPISKEQFLSDTENKLLGKLSSQKVGPTIADDIKNAAYMAVMFSLVVIFLYIVARFKKWQYGVGGVLTLIHDAIITISMYSLFYGILPFSLEIDQSFIAAILTIIGYSINDTVIIYDRIREYNHLYPKRELKSNFNAAINSTLGRTFMTSSTTLIVLIAIFIFGGETIRGFSFALMVGVIVGTYSSVFISSPIAYDFSMLLNKKRDKKLLAKKSKKRK